MPKPQPLAIAIDGPAGSGKSTVGRALASELGILYLDTGSMYRAVTWLAIQRHINIADEAGVTALARDARFDYPADDNNANQILFINGHDATPGLRAPAVDRAVSIVSSYEEVRKALVEDQRILAAARAVVMVGRDIGTVVLPNAPLKIYLDASADTRARRRFEERAAQGQNADLAAITGDMVSRDKRDSEREHSPLRAADDAVVVDSTGLSRDEVIATLVQLARQVRMDA